MISFTNSIPNIEKLVIFFCSHLVYIYKYTYADKARFGDVDSAVGLGGGGGDAAICSGERGRGKARVFGGTARGYFRRIQGDGGRWDGPENGRTDVDRCRPGERQDRRHLGRLYRYRGGARIVRTRHSLLYIFTFIYNNI